MAERTDCVCVLLKWRAAAKFIKFWVFGDIVCLLDSAVSEASNHPGFLAHDWPEGGIYERTPVP